MIIILYFESSIINFKMDDREAVVSVLVRVGNFTNVQVSLAHNMWQVPVRDKGSLGVVAFFLFFFFFLIRVLCVNAISLWIFGTLLCCCCCCFSFFLIWCFGRRSACGSFELSAWQWPPCGAGGGSGRGSRDDAGAGGARNSARFVWANGSARRSVSVFMDDGVRAA